MRGLLDALRFLSVLPLGRGGGPPGASAAWFPLAGAVLGALASLPLLAFPSPAGEAMAVALLAALTGGLHLDGLADTLDALGAPRERRLGVLRDSRVGAMGATGVALVLLLKTSLLLGLFGDRRPRALIAACALGRCTPLVPALRLSYARPRGTGMSFVEEMTPRRALAGVCLGLALCLLSLGPRGASAWAAAVGGGWAMGTWLSRRFGGLTGDLLGALVETGEVLCLASLVL